MAERLSARFETAPDARRAWYPAREVAAILTDAANSPMAAVQHVEDGTLPLQLANLAYEVSAISDGAQEGWSSELPPAATDLYPVLSNDLVAPTPLPADAEYPTFALPDLLLYQSGSDRLFHVTRYDGEGAAHDGDALGAGAPVAGPPRDGPALIADDRGESVFLPGGEPARRVRMPDAVEQGHEALGQWQIALTRNALWLLTNDDGVLRLRSTARSGDGQFNSAPVASFGEPDTMLDGLLAAAGGESVMVVALRRGATGVSIVGYVVTPPANETDSTAATRAAAGDALTAVVGPLPLMSERPAFDPHVIPCTYGSVSYALIVGDDRMTLAWVERGRADHLDAGYTEIGAPVEGHRLELSCNEDAALVFADLTGRDGALVHFDRARMHAGRIEPPRLGREPRVVGGALVSGGTVVALVDNRTTMRAWHIDAPADPNGAWRGGELVAYQVPPSPVTPDPNDVRLLTVETMVSHDAHIAALATVTLGTHVYVGRIASRDRGATWH
jgi:hypothetical protein